MNNELVEQVAEEIKRGLSPYHFQNDAQIQLYDCESIAKSIIPLIEQEVREQIMTSIEFANKVAKWMDDDR